MDLPNLFSNNSKVVTDELVLFLVVSDIQVQVLLLELSRSGVEIKEKSETFFYESLENFVTQTDQALQQLSKQSEKVNEIIFAVNVSWVTNGEVSDQKKPFFKKLTEDLGLKPLGFIDMSESIAQQKISSNALYSGLLLTVSKLELSITLVYQGKIKAVETVGSSSNFIGDFKEGVARIQKIVKQQGQYLPSKVVLISYDFSEEKLKEQQQLVYEQDWEENSEFLQPPTVEIIPTADLLDILAKEAGKSAAITKGLPNFAFAASVPTSNNAEATQDNVKNLDTKSMGFSDPLENTPTSFGIPIKSEEINLTAVEEDDNLKEASFDFAEVTSNKLEKTPPSKKPKKDWGHKKNIKWFAILGFLLGLFFLVLGLFIGGSYFSQTEVIVTLNKKPVAKDISIKLDTSISETNIEKLIIVADTVKKSATSKSTIQTTGIKIVGEAAKGTVAIYNKTDAVKKFDKGTLLKSGDLVFATNEEITIASASAKQGGEDYGKAEVGVTAQQIGAESNLKKNAELVVGSYDLSSYNAFIIDDDFLGGSSREVRVVAQKDKTELLTDLRTELIEKINAEFADESGNGVYILPSKSVVSEKAKFDAEVESEAENLSLNLEIEVEAVTYTGADLKPIAAEVLVKEVPENYELLDADPQILSSPSQTQLDKLGTGAVVEIEANISSYAVPVIPVDNLKTEVAGKSFTDVTSLLTKKEEISKVEYKVLPAFFTFIVKKVATNLDKITVTFIK